MKEQWRDVVGYEGIYKISDFGRVKRIKAYRSTYVGKILSPVLNCNGYGGVLLYENGKQKHWQCHRLVAIAFLGEPPQGKEVNHIDGNKTNNYLSNLEYVTKSENINHAYRLGLLKGRRGEDHHMTKLCESDIFEIRALVSRGNITHREIAEMYGVCRQTISDIWTKKRWGWLK